MTTMHARAVAIVACGIALLGPTISAQDLSRYRTFELGSSLASVSTTAVVAATEAKTLHQRPAVLQDLEWRPSHWSADSSSPSNDPVDRVVFSFYNDQLFRAVVDYGHDKTEGMTAADLIEAISATYGSPITRPATARIASRVEAISGTPLARWGGGDHTVVLYRTSAYREVFRLIVTALPLDDLARKAETQALRLDEQDAPRREIARQQKEKDDGLVAAEKARVLNKKVFRP